MMNYAPRASVIVPAYNASQTLTACLSALTHQTLPLNEYEIIVVDDGSIDNTGEIARGFGVHVVSQANAGPAAARNSGAKLAHAPILLFTDADCVPAPDWIELMLLAFDDLEVAGVKGVYRTQQPNLVARFVQLEYEDRYDRMRGQAQIDFIDTYSAGYRRDLFLAAGGFDTTFPTASVEDQEFSFRLAEAGRRLVFVPEAQVYHQHDRTMAEYVHRKFWIGYWKVQVMREHPGKLVSDSHTPQLLKLQMALAAIGGLLIVGAVLRRRLGLFGLLAWAFIPLSGFRLVIKAVHRDLPVAFVVPVMLFIRAWALGLGFLLGVLRYILRF